MDENTLQLMGILRLIWAVGYAWLYASGGISGKWKRRYVGSAFLTLGIVGFSIWLNTFSWWYLLFFFLVLGATSLGYGANETGKKIFKRGYCGLAYAVASLPIAIVNGAWVLLALHTFICLTVSITLGVNNPTSARSEETLVGFMIGLLPMFMIGG